MIFKAFVLVVLLFSLNKSGRPLLWATIYALLLAAPGLLSGQPAAEVLPSTFLAGATALVVFWLLHRTNNILLWWLTLLVGSGILLLLP